MQSYDSLSNLESLILLLQIKSTTKGHKHSKQKTDGQKFRVCFFSSNQNDLKQHFFFVMSCHSFCPGFFFKRDTLEVVAAAIFFHVSLDPHNQFFFCEKLLQNVWITTYDKGDRKIVVTVTQLADSPQVHHIVVKGSYPRCIALLIQTLWAKFLMMYVYWENNVLAHIVPRLYKTFFM